MRAGVQVYTRLVSAKYRLAIADLLHSIYSVGLPNRIGPKNYVWCRTPLGPKLKVRTVLAVFVFVCFVGPAVTKSVSA